MGLTPMLPCRRSVCGELAIVTCHALSVLVSDDVFVVHAAEELSASTNSHIVCRRQCSVQQRAPYLDLLRSILPAQVAKMFWTLRPASIQQISKIPPKFYLIEHQWDCRRIMAASTSAALTLKNGTNCWRSKNPVLGFANSAQVFLKARNLVSCNCLGATRGLVYVREALNLYAV